jgi:hypothetical protein
MHDFDQIRRYVAWKEQEVSDILRPINLFGVPAAERATTGIAERTPARKADLFDAVVVGGPSGHRWSAS